MSPRKKKRKLTPKNNLKPNLQSVVRYEENVCQKIETANIEEDSAERLQALKRKNFVKACEQVSYKAYLNYGTRFQLLYFPSCLNGKCKHDNKNETNIKEMSSSAEKSFKIEMKTNMWSEALEVCQLCIRPDQYLSANILKDIVEIMLNAHDSSYTDYSITDLIDKCQQILSQSFSTHPPCVMKSIRKCYYNFLTSCMVLKKNTFTSNAQHSCDEGIVKYCMDRLEYEISIESKNEALINKDEHIPEEMKENVKGLYWQKENCEIFELLDRPERIQRLMAVLESVIELLQFDLAIWNSRHRKNSEYHILRSQKPLMTYILWSKEVLLTGAVTNNCRQILRLFVYFVHLNYPEEHISTMTIWLNTMIQTFYICQANANSDYPNLGKYCNTFANIFYKIISEMPQESIIRILERIQPTYMRYLVGIIHIEKTLKETQGNDIIRILIDFVKYSRWQEFSQSNSEINVSEESVTVPNKNNELLMRLSKICKDFKPSLSTNIDERNVYPKFDPCDVKDNYSELNQNDVIQMLCITLEAYLNAYNIGNVQSTLEDLNEKLLQNDNVATETLSDPLSSYSVTETFIKKYRSIYEELKELMSEFEKISTRLPKVVKNFKKRIYSILRNNKVL